MIEAAIGEGAMGTVYRGRHLDVGRHFAIKVLHHAHQPDAKALARFRREAELAGRLRQENVVSVIDMGVTSHGDHFLVMDLAPGRRLSDLLDEGILRQQRALELLRQLCAGLQHAHDAGLIHRDFKPENVIVESLSDGRDHARIVDFGIAILGRQPGIHDDVERLTDKGMVVGTPQYMAPEQARGDTGDHRIDLYALGVVAYELVSGALPFDGTGAEVAYHNVHSPTPAMSVRAPGVFVEPALEAFVRKLLEKNPDERFPDAASAREWLELFARDRAAAGAELGLEGHAGDGASVRTRSAQPSVQPFEHLLDTSSLPAMNEPRDEDRAPMHRRARIALAALVGAAALIALFSLGRRDDAPPEPRPVATMETPVVAATSLPAYESAPATPVAASAPTDVDVEATSTIKTPPRPPAVAKVKERTQEPVVEVRAPSPPTIEELGALYASVGRALTKATKANETSTIDLWPRYRWVRFMEAVKTPESRARAAEILHRLQDDLRAVTN